MDQEVLSHRKVATEEPIEMAGLPGDVSPSKSLDAASIGAKSDPNDITEETVTTGEKQRSRDPRTEKQKKTEKIQFAALCWCIFLAGWNDGSTGPLLPRIQDVYHVRSHIQHLIFFGLSIYHRLASPSFL